MSTAPRHSRHACTSLSLRREWRQLNSTEKTAYIVAVKCLQEFPSELTGIGRRSDDFPWVHRHVATSIHDTALFLPYHRYLLHLYENSLRELCNYSGALTYWDWQLDWQDPARSPIWDPDTGFGGSGDPAGELTVGWGSCVPNGPFRDYKVLFYDFVLKLHCLSRGFGRCFGRNGTWSGEPFKPSVIQQVMEQETFANFSAALETGPHDAVPNNVCGDFYYLESPNDPVFFLHHTNLDRLWANWQAEKPSRKLEYNGRASKDDTKAAASVNDVLGMKGLGPDLAVKEVMNTQSGILCYRYK
ncbi:putative domain, di-copper centre [Beauveria brongniartii RCEF 3172]|uniref:Putative domain, di-copper centre n=1 Tax=Beauveria brongniartii RCEF 3172 TaxID=1081107 RepID=A0A168EXD0_9HYPO|nr:putative domain, di-copper centre [Beauveria brongniartii RCEF 3172]